MPNFMSYVLFYTTVIGPVKFRCQMIVLLLIGHDVYKPFVTDRLKRFDTLVFPTDIL